MGSIVSSWNSGRQASYPLGLSALWLFYRVIVLAYTSVISSLRPLSALEHTMEPWPPVAPLGLWLARVGISPMLRWDAVIYARIAEQGYRLSDGTLAFHPLFPLLAWPLVRLGVVPSGALVVVSCMATLGLIFAACHLFVLDVSPASAHSAVLFLITSPLGVALLWPYPEALFLLMVALCLASIRRRRWLLAGLAGGFATLTRQQGILLVLPVVIEMYGEFRRAVRISPWSLSRTVFTVASAMLIPAAYLSWTFYRIVVIGDSALDVSSIHSAIYSILVSASASQVVPGQTFTWPWLAFGLALGKLRYAPDLDIIVNLVLALYFGGLVLLAWRHLRPSDRAYVVATAVISFGFTTGPVHPYMGLPRHLLLAMPIYVGVGARFPNGRMKGILCAVGVLSQLFLTLLYVLEAWVP